MIASLINLIFTVLEALIFIRIIMSWIMPYNNNEFSKLVYSITEPMLKPFRIMIPIGQMGGLDLSPLILILILNLVQRLILSII